MTNLEQKLKELGDTLFAHINTDPINIIQETGLYVGQGGIILFLAHYLKKFPNKDHEDIYDNYLRGFLEELTSRPQTVLSYCTGLVGALTCLELMNNASLIDLDVSEVREAYRDKMWTWMNYSFANHNYDLLHGALGVAMYFRNDPQYIEAALLWLERTSIKNDKKIKWISSLGLERPMGYNICLSHGISSIIIYLSQIFRSGVMTELNKQLIEGAVNYILSQEIDHEKYGCFFPSQSLENGDPAHKSRLAWCYGDLGVAAALWQVGQATKNASWMNKALEVYRFSANRTNLQDAMVNDAGICHGTAGIAMMFSYMHEQTSDSALREARDYWIMQTLMMSKFSDGLAGYKKFTVDEDKRTKLENSCSLLEGIAGIGFMLLSTFDKDAGKDILDSFALY